MPLGRRSRLTADFELYWKLDTAGQIEPSKRAPNASAYRREYNQKVFETADTH